MYPEHTDNLNDAELGERLRALPGFEPPAGGWSALQRRLDRRPNRHPYAWGGGLALAASTLIAALLLWPASAPEILQSPSPTALSRLIGESRALEYELSAARPQVVVWDSAREARVEAVQRNITFLDLQLSYIDARQQPREAEMLWRQRVALMAQLVDLHQSATPAAIPVAYQLARVD